MSHPATIYRGRLQQRAWLNQLLKRLGRRLGNAGIFQSYRGPLRGQSPRLRWPTGPCQCDWACLAAVPFSLETAWHHNSTVFCIRRNLGAAGRAVHETPPKQNQLTLNTIGAQASNGVRADLLVRNGDM